MIFLICLFCWKYEEMRKEDDILGVGLYYLFKVLIVLSIMVCFLYFSGMIKIIIFFFIFMYFNLDF